MNCEDFNLCKRFYGGPEQFNDELTYIVSLYIAHKRYKVRLPMDMGPAKLFLSRQLMQSTASKNITSRWIAKF